RARRLSIPPRKIAVKGIGAMQIQTRGAKAILAQVERPYERSPLFEWLFEHHDDVIAAAAGRRVEWSRLCGEFARSTREWRRCAPPNARSAKGVRRQTRVATCPPNSGRATTGRPLRPRRK